MKPDPFLPTPPVESGLSQPASKALGLLLVVEALLSFAPIAILGPAIGWPASLGNPAAQQLAAVHAAPAAVNVGYAVYLLYSVLVAPVMIGLALRCLGRSPGWALISVVALASLSTLARAVGILRWMTVMPVLATAHAGADTAARPGIELLFSALTRWGGGIGELLGVSLFMGLALATLCGAAWRSGGMPRSLALGGLVSAALLLGLFLPALRLPAVVPVAVAVTVLTLWMLAAGAWCYLVPKMRSPASPKPGTM